ncbi:MAG: hypothetical protein CSA04_02070 [Bacteroidetes bacterium]|nr:MAG: hypothetical protein CSA04_02070 [Bacteroidota bacterium]
MDDILHKILNAKEQRQRIRQQSGEVGNATISISFNIPGYPKSDERITQTFRVVRDDLAHYLVALRIPVDKKQVIVRCDEAGDIAFFPFQAKQQELPLFKEKLEAFEQTHPLGRLLDVDLFDGKANAISSHKQKTCFICKETPALHCMRNQTHSYEELRAHLREKMEKFLEERAEQQVSKQLAATALWAILTEVALPHKPGLVSPQSSGSHQDMNFHTFLASTSAITPHFQRVAIRGYQWNGKEPQAVLTQLRISGLEMEKDMFLTTQGVNTQKGVIFLMTFSLFTMAYTLKKTGTFDETVFKETLQTLNKGLVNRELKGSSNQNRSHGEQCFNTFGEELAGGIRKEVEQGLPTFFHEVTPFMKKIGFSSTDYRDQSHFENQCKRLLVKIMSINNDTNILFRSDAQTLHLLQEKSLKTLQGNEDLTKNESYGELMAFCTTKKISPGGSADLLAVSLFLDNVRTKTQKNTF